MATISHATGSRAHPRRTRILLIAYEFSPSTSPQSLRWTYLCAGLAALGHEVHVMAPDIGGLPDGLPHLPAEVVVHRIHPGPVKAILRGLAARRPAPSETSIQADALPAAALGIRPARLNWKGRLVERVQDAVSSVTFPDIRGEWRRPAQQALGPLLQRLQPDAVISSHEPATSLQLGLEARRAGFKWVADLGDPVLAPYTPRRWRTRAAQLEREVLMAADHVLVTTDATRDLLRNRYPEGRAPVSVLTQGFDSEWTAGGQLEPVFETDRLELLYSGSFYAFRRPTALLDAVLHTPGVRLNIATSRLPEEIETLAAQRPDKVRVLGYLPHRMMLGVQRQAAVLVNLANDDDTQVPGKLYEYFGASRPILHVMTNESDSVGELLHRLRRGIACGEYNVAAELAELRDSWLAGQLDVRFDLRPDGVDLYSWSALARQLDDVIAVAANREVA